MQADLSDAAKAEIARRERERLKLQERLKREKIERMRLEANQGAGAGEVGVRRWLALQAAPVKPVCKLVQCCGLFFGEGQKPGWHCGGHFCLLVLLWRS